jgi:molybdate transport system substrate-binding protein
MDFVPRRSFIRSLLAALLVLSLSACAAPGAQSRELTVFAASSLRDAFRDLGAAFERANPGVSVVFNYAGTPQLVEQINAAAPADVFASANQKLMDAVVAKGRVDAGAAVVFARNRLVVIAPRAKTGAGSVVSVRSLADLAKPGVKLVLADAAVPVGGYVRDMLKKASADAVFGANFEAAALANLVSNEEDVRAVFSKVALGEADAGVVYASDVTRDAAGQVITIAIPSAFNTIATYPIAPLRGAKDAALARAFVDFALSLEGQAILRAHGFDAPAQP